MIAHPDCIVIRRGTPDDRASIEALVMAAYAKWVPLIGRQPQPMTADYATALRDHRFDLMWRGGSLEALVETEAHPGHLLIINLAVRPGAQGQGLGTRLLGLAETLAGEAGLTELRLYTNARFTENIGLYARRGYRETHREPYAGGTVVHMAKRI